MCLISHYFHLTTHNLHSSLIFFKIPDTICKNLVVHILCICTTKIMHQSSKFCFILNLGIYIYNMFLILK